MDSEELQEQCAGKHNFAIKFMEKLIDIISKKKEIKGIEREFIQEIIEEYIKQNPTKYELLKEKNFNPKSKEFDDIKKFTRKKLRTLHGVFQKNKLSERKKDFYLLKKDFDFESESTQKFLKSHLSTYERINFYPSLYNEIEKRTGKIETLIDLACGLNPLSYSLLKDLKKAICYDINREEINFIKEFFEKIEKIENEVDVLDLTKTKSLNTISNISKNIDCCFLFKTLDSLESIKRGTSKELIQKINSKFIIISFSNKTISGKNNITSKRTWFKKIIDAKKIDNKKIEMLNFGYEDYYIIHNN